MVVWRQLGLTIETIESLRASTVQIDQVICVAQELTDDEFVALRSAIPDGELIKLDANIGFAAAANLGMDRANARGSQFVLLMNNDAAVSPTCLEWCLDEFARHDRVAVVGPAVAYQSRPDRLWFAGGRSNDTFAIAWHRGKFARASHPPATCESDYIPSCCALISLDAWRHVGPFCEEYFMYFEDVEWGDPPRRLGWHLRYLGEVLCRHVMGGSGENPGERYLSSDTAYYLARNPILFARSSPSRSIRFTRTFGALFIWGAYNVTRIRPSNWRTVGVAMVRGMSDGLFGRTGRRDLASAQQVRAN